MVVTKKQVTVTLTPSKWSAYGAIVQSLYGTNMVSSQLEKLIEGETARLQGDVDSILQSIIHTLRDISSSVQNTESKAFLVKAIETLDTWVQTNRGTTFAATDIQTDYVLLQKQYTSEVKRSDELKKILKGKDRDCYNDLLELSIDCGLDFDSDFSNLKEVINRMMSVAEDPKRAINEENLQLYISLLEVGKTKRMLERRMKDIQRKTYQGKGKTSVPVEAE